MSNNVVLAFAGPIGSGKSTLASRISKELRWPITSFGAYVRSWAKGNGFTESRKDLQIVGNLLISQGWIPFCEKVIAQVNWSPPSNLIVDGVRHVKALDSLRILVKPAELCLIFVYLEDQARLLRLKEREKEKGINLRDLESDPTELEVNSLRSQADLIINNDRPFEESVKIILDWIKELN